MKIIISSEMSWWRFKVTDKYGHLLATSVPFDTEDKARKAVRRLKWKMFLAVISGGI